VASRSISEAADAARAARRKVEASPQLSDWKREFGNKVSVNERTGDYSLNLRDRDDIKKAYQMQEGARKLEVERGAELQSRWDGKKEKVVRRDGRVMDVPEELIDNVKHKVRPAGRNGKGTSLKFGLSSSFGKYEQGPDGLWFVWDDGWEPTKLFLKGEVGDRQRDPDGNTWVKVDGEWEIDSEA